MALTLVTGPMFSGKSSFLLNWALSRQKVFTFKHKSDDRYGPDVTTHSGSSRPCEYLASSFAGAFQAFLAFAESEETRLLDEAWQKENQDRIPDFVSQPSLHELALAENPDWFPDPSLYSIVIDEAHLFKDTQAVDMFLKMGCDVVAAGLAGGTLGSPLTSMSSLLGKATTLHHLHAVCGFCGADDASFTADLAPDPATYIGGSERYKPACYRCRFRAELNV